MFSITEQNEKTVLVVNDQADQRELMSLLLRTAGYRVLNASDGREGFALARREHPAALISDVTMPGVNGIELCQLVRHDAELCTMPVLLVSALRFGTPAVVEGLQAGADDYLEAPYDSLRLVAKLSRLIERKQMEHALREADERYRSLFENSNDLIQSVALDGRLLYVNRSWRETLGYQEVEINGLSVFDIIHPDHQARWSEMLQRTMSGANVTAIEVMFVAQDGREIPVEGSTSWSLLNGKPISTQGIFRDITGRRAAEDALQRRDAILEAVSFAAARFLQSEDWEQSINQVLARLGEVTTACRVYIFENQTSLPGALTTSQRWEWVAPGIAPQIENPKLQTLSLDTEGFSLLKEKLSHGGIMHGHVKDFPADIREHLAAQDILSLAVVPIFVEHQWWGFIGFDECLRERAWPAVEIDALKIASSTLGAAMARRQAEEKQTQLQATIRKAEQEWQLTFDAIESLVVITDLEGRIVQLNRMAKDLAGQSYEQIIGQSIDTFGLEQPWRQAAELINSMRATQTAASAQVQDETSGQTWEISANSISDLEAGSERRIILVARDMTQSVEQQETLRRSETMSMMGELVVGVAHEVRNPLFGVASVLDAFEAKLDERSEYRTYSRMLREGLDRISELMHELLEYGKPLTQKLYPGNVEEMIMLAVRACEQLADRSGVRIVHHPNQELPLVTMDRRRLPQVFQNLIENAIHHSTPGGIVTISAKTVCLKNKSWIECYVSDTGAGFRPEDLRNVFKPFFTRRRGGTGLGLPIAQRVMEEHGGRVTAGNQPGAGGAIMTVRFPSTVTHEMSQGGAAR